MKTTIGHILDDELPDISPKLRRIILADLKRNGGDTPEQMKVRLETIIQTMDLTGTIKPPRN